MKQIFFGVVFFIALVLVSMDAPKVKAQYQERFYPSHKPLVMMQPVAYDTQDEDQVAWDQFNAFAKAHDLIGGYQHPTEDSWSLALFVGDDADVPKWAVYDFTSLPEAVQQIEADYAKYPDGHETRK